MGAVGHFLFGDKQKTEEHYGKPTPTVDKSQKALIDALANLQKAQLGQGVEPYQGNTVADISAYQPAINVAEQKPQLGETYQTGSTLLDSMLQPNSQQSQQYWEQSFIKPALKNWQQRIMPRVRESFISRGAGESGGANRAIARSAEDMNTDLMAQLGNILNESQNRALQAAPLALEYAKAPIDVNQTYLSNLTNVGNLQHTYQQSLLNEQYKKWLMSQPYSNPYVSALYGNPYVATRPTLTLNRPTVSQTGGSGGLLGGIAGGFGSALGGALGKNIF